MSYITFINISLVLFVLPTNSLCLPFLSGGESLIWPDVAKKFAWDEIANKKNHNYNPNLLTKVKSLQTDVTNELKRTKYDASIVGELTNIVQEINEDIQKIDILYNLLWINLKSPQDYQTAAQRVQLLGSLDDAKTQLDNTYKNAKEFSEREKLNKLISKDTTIKCKTIKIFEKFYARIYEIITYAEVEFLIMEVYHLELIQASKTKVDNMQKKYTEQFFERLDSIHNYFEQLINSGKKECK